MKFASVCTGIGAPEVAWVKLGWKPQWFSEIEPFPCRVLAHHYPTVPNLGDMTQLESNETFQRSDFDVLVGGTPCQSFSLAGLRGGMADSRGNLALVFCRLLVAKRPKWFVWENVPGVFSSFSNEAEGDPLEGAGLGDERDITETADFATLLTAFRECGYSVAYRVLDSQHFGVPQRRRRVFVVGYLGNDWRPPFAVLFERDSLRRNLTPGREKGQVVAGTINASAARSRGCGTDPGMITAETIHAGYGDKSDRGDGKNLICMAHGQGGAEVLSNHSPTLTCNHEAPIVSGPFTFDKAQITSPTNRSSAASELCHTLSADGQHHLVQPYILHGSDGTKSTATETDTATALRTKPPGSIENSSTTVVMQPVPINTQMDLRGPDTSNTSREGLGIGEEGDPAFTITKAHPHALAHATMVRRLTPLECERLQGFPDNYTAIPKAADGPRYKSLGNSMTTYVLEWIGGRIDRVSKLLKTLNHV